VSRKNGGLRKALPENFEYVFIEFEPDEGLLHVIEKGNKFQPNEMNVSLKEPPRRAFPNGRASIQLRQSRRR